MDLRYLSGSCPKYSEIKYAQKYFILFKDCISLNINTIITKLPLEVIRFEDTKLLYLKLLYWSTDYEVWTHNLLKEETIS